VNICGVFFFLFLWVQITKVVKIAQATPELQPKTDWRAFTAHAGGV